MTLNDILNKEYRSIFEETWPLWFGGALIGLMSIITFTFARPWGVVGGIRNMGDWFFYEIGLYTRQPPPFWSSTSTTLTLGLLSGALIAALAARQFALRVPPKFELFKGALGGILLGIGATLAGGCNVGGFYSALSAHSMSGFAMLIGLLGGAYAGLKYLYWELEHVPQQNAPARTARKAETTDFRKYQPFLGGILFLGLLLAHKFYSMDGYIVPGGLLLCGAAFGFILHRSRFCFARCFREPFMTGEGAATQAVIISLSISTIGFAVIKWSGLRSELASVPASFGLGGLAGGCIFGFGMLVAGACGSGCVWRAAEGQVKLITTFITYALAASLAKTGVRALPWLHALLGKKVYLPAYFGYPTSTLLILTMLWIWYVAVTWNEATEKMVIQM